MVPQLSSHSRVVLPLQLTQPHAHRPNWPEQSLIEILFIGDSSLCQLTVKVDYHAILEAQGVHNISETKIQSHHGVNTASLGSKQGSRDRESLGPVSRRSSWAVKVPGTTLMTHGTHELGSGCLCLFQRKNKMGLLLSVTWDPQEIFPRGLTAPALTTEERRLFLSRTSRKSIASIMLSTAQPYSPHKHDAAPYEDSTRSGLWPPCKVLDCMIFHLCIPPQEDSDNKEIWKSPAL